MRGRDHAWAHLKSRGPPADDDSMATSTPPEKTIQRRFVPFALVGLLAPLTALIPPQPENWSLIRLAIALTLVIALAGVLTPWSRLPRWTYLVPPLAYFVVVSILRQANDGSVSGYAPLALLPVVWIALNLGRREVALAVGIGTSVFFFPLLVGDPASYTSADWRHGLLWAAIAALVGFSVEALMREKRTETRVAREQASVLAEHERTLAAIADVSRALTAETDARAHICQAAIDVAGASFAAIWEPDGGDALVLTGRAGPDPGQNRFRLHGESSGYVRAFTTGARYFVSDAASDPNLSQDTVLKTGVVSMLFEPIVQGGEPVGVLSVGWSTRVSDVDEHVTQAVRLLSTEAAVAIERSDLLARLNHLADTDELTGLPNRRAWDETIGHEVARAAASGADLCVALVDLDRFKDFNDRNGHQAGDRLLKSAAAAWRTALRQTDTLARYGGEEFAVALPSCSAPEAEAVLERLRTLTPEGQTCSIGLAAWRPGESGAELLARADEALYDAKRGGRDALVVMA